ncbi:MAG: PilN domain-containing protein [Fimbriimonadaceae bacterium]|nr:PilN domain-containing protein [Fimbriimonadaceae bacterium]
MPLINLIQEQRIEARSKQKQIQIALFGTMGIGALSVLGTLALMFDATRLNLYAGALEQKKIEIQPTLDELTANQEALDQMRPRVQTLETAQKDSTKWEEVLAYLTQNTPPTVWLTNVKAFKQDAATPMVLTFNGVSLTQEAVGDFQYRLGVCSELENPQLKYTQPRFSDKFRQFEFELSADMKGTKEEDSAAKEVTKP